MCVVFHRFRENIGRDIGSPNCKQKENVHLQENDFELFNWRYEKKLEKG